MRCVRTSTARTARYSPACGSDVSKWLNWARRRDAPHVVDAVEISGAAVPRALMEDLDDCLTKVFGVGTATQRNWTTNDGYKPSVDVLKEEGKL